MHLSFPETPLLSLATSRMNLLENLRQDCRGWLEKPVSGWHILSNMRSRYGYGLVANALHSYLVNTLLDRLEKDIFHADTSISRFLHSFVKVNLSIPDAKCCVKDLPKF